MDPIKLISTLLLVTTSLATFGYMFYTQKNGLKPENRFEEFTEDLACWSLAWAAIAMALWPDASEVSTLYLWWRGSVAFFVLTMLYRRVHFLV